MKRNELQLYRIRFSYTDFLKLPEKDQLFFIQLAQVADDLRHVFYLCVAAEKGSRSASADERKLGLHALLFGVRLIYSILNEGWKVISDTWTRQAFGKRWHPRLSPEARKHLKFLRRYFGKPNLSRTIRHNFGFHYLPDPIRESIRHVPERAAEIITGKHRANVFYTFAEEVRALGLLQSAQPQDARKIWHENASKEDIRAAAIHLYEAYKPVVAAFDALAYDVLLTVIKSLWYKVERFIAPRVTKFSEMSPVLFVEEPS